MERLRQTPRLDLVKTVLRPGLESLGRGRELFVYGLESAAQPSAGPSARARTLDDVQPNRPVSPVGDALHGVLAAHRGQPVAGVDPGDRRTVQHGRRPVARGGGGGPAEGFRSFPSPPGARRDRETFASPRSRSAPWSSCATR